MNIVSHYISAVLVPELLKAGVSQAFVIYTAETAAMQMNSLLRHWNDASFRNTVLLLGLEEGSFYEPPVKLDVRCFVVVTLRNSPIEVLQSDAYAKSGLKSPLCKQAYDTDSYDLYAKLKEKYPVAWSALQNTAVNSAKITDYPKVITDAYELDELSKVQFEDSENINYKKSVFDGYDSALDEPLLFVLANLIRSEQAGFVTDSFKSLTRNAEKLFRIIEFLLTHGCSFTTSNVHLENGHTEKRSKPLRASHTEKEMRDNLSQTKGLGYRHKLCLNSLAKQ